MLQVLTIIAPSFFIIFLSAFLRKFKNIGSNWSKSLNEFIFNIGLPVLIFSSISKTPLDLKGESTLVITNSIFILLIFSLIILFGKIFHLNKQMLKTLFICSVFSNFAYLGIPVLTQLSGQEILPTISLIIAIYLFWIFTVGIGYLDYLENKNNKQTFKNIFSKLIKIPPLVAVVLGIIFGSLKITTPLFLQEAFSMISGSVTPIVLVIIGLFIGSSKIGKISEWKPILIFSLFTLFVLPFVFYIITKLLGYSTPQLSSSILEAAMPLGINPFILSDKYNLDKAFISRSIVLSTILSVITLTFWISIL